MKKLHIEFDMIVTDKTAMELQDAPDICLTDNILEALEATDECEYIENFKITNNEETNPNPPRPACTDADGVRERSGKCTVATRCYKPSTSE